MTQDSETPQAGPLPPGRAPTVDLSTPAGRLRAHLHAQFKDHAFLRLLWRNEDEIAPGVWRSNHPGHLRLAAWKRRGIRSVISLRATGMHLPPHLLEAERCAALGLPLYVHRLSAHRLMARTDILALLDTFEAAQRPTVMHCKSGADRSGLAAFLYLCHMTETPPARALDQFHWRYMHFSTDATGILDHMAASYVAAHAETGIALRPWIEQEYDPETLTASFTGRRSTR